MEVYAATLDSSGRVMLPADVRREDGRISMTSRKEALRRAQEFFSSVEPDRILSEELSKDRQREAQAELED